IGQFLLPASDSLARLRAIPPAPSALGGYRERRRSTGLTDHPDERRLVAGTGLPSHGNMPTAAEGEAFEQSVEQARTGRMIIGDVGHQLPALLLDFEDAFGCTRLRSVILRLEQRGEE